MKLQNLAVIFLIIVVPITLILSAYIGTQIDILAKHQGYDTKLMDATHDAVVAFQLNTVNNQYSTNADSLRRDIKAAINTFYTSLTTSMQSSKIDVNPYIPALVFTLYDGYYIYSAYPYQKDGGGKEYQRVLKPYVHYSMRYKTNDDNDDNDVVINYSLDNYIAVYGKIRGTYVARAGYLIDINTLEVEGGKVKRYAPIKEDPGYKLDVTEREHLSQSKSDSTPENWESDSVRKYYQEAYEFSNWINTSGIKDIVRPKNAKRSDLNGYTNFSGDNTSILNISSSNNPEELNSAFNQHKREVMKESIQENLNNAIATYNKHSTAFGANTYFVMPKLTDLDWEKLLTNVNMISFMQGMPVNGKIYNNYAIVTSTKNKQYIDPKSLYFIETNTNTYHRINCPKLGDRIKNGSTRNIVGYKSVDFMMIKDNESRYYYRHKEYADYYCIVNTLDAEISFKDLTNEQRRAYFYALARERYDLNKSTQMLIKRTT